jgi:hypothetical protein
MSLADSLRKLHDAGKAHGAVTPSSIVVTATGLDLIPSLGPLATVTPYTAPEVLQGQPADARSDIFSFGALVFEMLTGRRAFDGAGQTELKLALCNSAPPPSGSPVAKSPAARWQRMQKIIMELKLLTVAARRADAAPAARGVSDTALRSEIQQLEGRLSARLAAYEKNIAAMQQAAGEAVESLRKQLAAVQTQFAAVEARPVSAAVNVDALTQQIHARMQETIGAVTQQLHTHVQETVAAATRQDSAQVQEALGTVQQQLATQVKATVDAANQKHAEKVQETIAAAAQQHASQVQETIAAVNQRMAAGEQNMEEIRKHFATLQANVAGDLHDFEKTLKAQSVAIESARTAMAQTDDLLERVVEALELLQSSMLDQHETAGVN